MLTSQFQRIFSLSMSFLMVLTLLAACGGGVKDTAIPAPPDSTRVEGEGEGTVGMMLGIVQPMLEEELQKENVTVDKQEAYTSKASLNEAVDFYKAQMKERGWSTTEDGEKIDTTQGTAVLAYESGKQGALIMIFDMSSTGEEGLLVMTANAHE